MGVICAILHLEMSASRLSSPEEPLPRFFPNSAPETIKDVMRSPLVLDKPPFKYHHLSPTPLDPHLLQIKGGPRYNEHALTYMVNAPRQVGTSRFASDEQITSWIAYRLATVPKGNIDSLGSDVVDTTWLSVLSEIMAQHELKQHRNDAAVRLLFDDTTPITRDEAEELMQIRAGIASPEVILRFFARHPELGGVELMKATRAFQPELIQQARNKFLGMLATSSEALDIEFLDESPYRRIRIEDPRIIVLKTRLATVAYNGMLMEVVMRDSGVILDQAQDDLTTSYITCRDEEGHPLVYVAPIAITAYARMAAVQGQDEASS